MARIYLLLLFFFGGAACLVAQNTPNAATAKPDKPAVDHSYKPLTLKLNEDGSKYVRFLMWHQFWATYTQNNPGTVDVQGQETDNSFDIALRRSRFLAYAQISPRFLILTHWGINNQSFINGGPNAGTSVQLAAGASNAGKKPQLFMHDAWGEFEAVKDKLYIGIGLHYWNGVSRMSSASTLNFMTIDAPIFNWPNIEATDQFARQFGFYAKGQLGRLDYRLALNKPFAFGAAPAQVANNGIAVNVLNENWATAGYVNWMFWDKENNKLPFFVGSHLGGKKILNVGAGFYHHPDASLYKLGADSSFHDHLQLGADAIMELPLNKEKGAMFHALATYYNFDFGPNYLRNIGILNLHTTPTPTSESFAGGGNAQPTIGTGNIFYLQTGYLLPKLKNGSAFMPYATLTHKDFGRLADASTQYGLGMNYFVVGHHAKITLEYQTRPVYVTQGAANVLDGYRGEFILQTHIFL